MDGFPTLNDNVPYTTLFHSGDHYDAVLPESGSCSCSIPVPLLKGSIVSNESDDDENSDYDCILQQDVQIQEVIQNEMSFCSDKANTRNNNN